MDENSLNLLSSDFQPDCSIRFFKGNQEVAKFDFNQSPATFTGDVDYAAKVFGDMVIENVKNWQSCKSPTT